MDEFLERKRQFKLILMLLIGICIAMTMLTIIWEVNYFKTYGFFSKTNAEVVDQQIDNNGNVFDILKYNVDGIDYIVKSDKISENKIGDKYKVYYDTNNPIGLIYNLNYKVYMLPIVTMLFSIITILLGLFYLYKFCNYKKIINFEKILKKKKKDVKI